MYDKIHYKLKKKKKEKKKEKDSEQLERSFIFKSGGKSRLRLSSKWQNWGFMKPRINYN